MVKFDSPRTGPTQQRRLKYYGFVCAIMASFVPTEHLPHSDYCLDPLLAHELNRHSNADSNIMASLVPAVHLPHSDYCLEPLLAHELNRLSNADSNIMALFVPTVHRPHSDYCFEPLLGGEYGVNGTHLKLTFLCCNPLGEYVMDGTH